MDSNTSLFQDGQSEGSSNNVEWVSDLINTDTRSWDIAKVNITFLPFEAKVILGIPIRSRLPIDALTWA